MLENILAFGSSALETSHHKERLTPRSVSVRRCKMLSQLLATYPGRQRIDYCGIPEADDYSGVNGVLRFKDVC
jgi:hypothetical protein